MKYLNTAVIAFCMVGFASIYTPCAIADAAMDALNANHFDEARRLFLQQLPSAETKNTALIYLGKIELYAGNYDMAISYLQQAIVADPNSAVGHLLLGRSYGQKAQITSIFSALGLAKQCIASFEKAHVLDPENSEVLQALVEYHAAAPAIVGGSQEKFLQYMSELKKVSPQMAAVYEIDNLEKHKQHEKAIALALDIKQKQDLTIKPQFLLARYFKENKSYPEAEEILEKLINIPITDKNTFDDRWYINDASLQLGEVFLATNKQLNRAVGLVKSFQEHNNNPNDIHYFWGFWSLAKIYKANGKLDNYKSEVEYIKTLDYKKNKYFAKEFEEALKNEM